MQAPEHAARPGAHELVHVPALQSGVAPPQTIPHPPQWFGLVASSTQAPSQNALPGGHVHRPPRQAPPIAHVVPQPPQWRGSLLASTQLPEQSVSSGLHPSAQLARLHTG